MEDLGSIAGGGKAKKKLFGLHPKSREETYLWPVSKPHALERVRRMTSGF